MPYQANNLSHNKSVSTYLKSVCTSPFYSAIHRRYLWSGIRSFLICVTILLFFLLTLASCSPKGEDGAILDAFASDFRAANNGMSIEPMLALYSLDGSTDRTKIMLKNALLYEHGLPILSINFEPLIGSPDEQIEYTYEGIKYGPSIKPIYRMRVRYRTEDRFESLFTIGKNPQGAWRIVSSKPAEEFPSDL